MSSNDQNFIEENGDRDPLGFVMDEIESHQFQSLQPTVAHPFVDLLVVPRIGDPLEGRNDENDCSLVIPPPVELRPEFSFQQAQPVDAEDVLNAVPRYNQDDDSHFATTIDKTAAGMTPTMTPAPSTPIQQVPVTHVVQQSPPEVVTTMIDTTGKGGSKSARPSPQSFGFPPASTGRPKRACRNDAAAIIDRDAASATHVDGSIAQKRNEKLREKGAAKAAQ